jgi:tetratricopeptide (TPR) repeat protein
MKKVLCLIAALTLALSSLGCTKIEARMQIKAANEAYQKEDYAAALPRYKKAREIDPSFPDLDRLVGYSEIGLYVPDDKSPKNEAHANAAIQELNKYLRERPDDRIARDALINLYLNANKTSEAIDYFRNYLQGHPADLDAVKSIATLYAKQGDFNESLNWYKKITLLDAHNPEAFYIFGVVCYEKVSKNPPADMAQKVDIINQLWRQQALTETDPLKAQADIVQADALRARAMALNAAKKAAGTKKS